MDLNSAIPEILSHSVEDSSPEVRIASLKALINLEYDGIEEAIFTALEDENENVRMNALQAIPDLNLPNETIVALIQLMLENGTIEERQTALRTLGRIEDSSSFEVLDQQMDLLISGELTPEVQLDLVLAVESAGSESLNERLQAYKTEKSRDDSVSVYRESLKGGDVVQGRQIFYQNEAAQCIRCHVVSGEGSEVGPDLTSVGTRLSREELLESMVHPDAYITPGYGTVTLTLNDGETVQGALTAETETQVTVTSGGEERVVDKTDIEKRTNSPSGMPAQGDILTRSELRDLVEFLVNLQGSE